MTGTDELAVMIALGTFLAAGGLIALSLRFLRSVLSLGVDDQGGKDD